MSKPSAHCVNAMRWLKVNGHKLAMLTGQDARALAAVAHCWDLYAGADEAGKRAALESVRLLLNAMQAKCHPLAKELIAHAMDWSDRDRLWPKIVPPF